MNSKLQNTLLIELNRLKPSKISRWTPTYSLPTLLNYYLQYYQQKLFVVVLPYTFFFQRKQRGSILVQKLIIFDKGRILRYGSYSKNISYFYQR